MKRVRSNETGPHLLSPLEYDVYRLIEGWPKRADPERIRSSLPRASLPEVERALASLEEEGYVERIVRGDDATGTVELLRLTPWGKMVATTAGFWWRQELRDWLVKHSRGEVSDDSRPRRSLVTVELAPWEVGPSFDELDVEALDLPTRARNALRHCRVSTVGQLVRMTAKEFGEVKNVGAKTVEYVRNELRSVALDLAPPGTRASAAGAEAPVFGRPGVAYPDWRDQPSLYEVFYRSKGLIGVDPESREERVLWTKLLLEMGYALDHWRTSAGGERGGESCVERAFDAFIRLVEPLWWRKRSPRELGEAELERVIGLIGEYEPPESRGWTFRQAVSDGREATWRLLEGAVTAAVETFVRGKDGEGLRRCASLIEAVAVEKGWGGEIGASASIHQLD